LIQEVIWKFPQMTFFIFFSADAHCPGWGCANYPPPGALHSGDGYGTRCSEKKRSMQKNETCPAAWYAIRGRFGVSEKCTITASEKYREIYLYLFVKPVDI
jgi:hypothetical protein